MAAVDYTRRYLEEVRSITDRLDPEGIDRMIELLVALRERNGRLFFLGVGGGAAHAGHAAADFRKIAGIESYAVTDHVTELTARINDDGWESSYADWLRSSRISSRDAVFVFSVGGGDRERGISTNLIAALDAAHAVGALIFGIIGREEGYTARVADACLVVPTTTADSITPHTEGFQAVLTHLIVSHPQLRRHAMKWESTK